MTISVQLIFDMSSAVFEGGSEPAPYKCREDSRWRGELTKGKLLWSCRRLTTTVQCGVKA